MTRLLASAARWCATASLVLFSVSALPALAAQLKVLVRYDDYSAYSSMQVERNLFAEVTALGGGLVVGVIPFPNTDYPSADSSAPAQRAILDSEKIALLSALASTGRVEVAVHGYSHRNNAPAGLRSEFSVLPQAMQARLARDARASLEQSLGTAVTSFIPPFNAYDSRTLEALRAAGYKMLSAGGGGATLADGALEYVPGSTYAQSVKSGVEEALRRGHTDALIVPVLHPYDIAESGGEMPTFRKGASAVTMSSLADDLRAVANLPNVRFVSLSDLRAAGEDFSADRLAANAALRSSAIVRHRLLPQFLDLYPVDGLYYSKQSASSIRYRLVAAALVLYGSAIGFSIFAARAVVRWLARRSAARPGLIAGFATIAVAAALAGIVWRVQSSGMYMNSAFALACCVGALAGIAVAQRRPAVHG